MDDILIDEKKYLSSKYAAKITGYAKDYIGQLCREGRVPARLVGRSWYVLESAIRDHRFGDVKSDENSTEKESPVVSIHMKTWEAPRYEAIQQAELLPATHTERESNKRQGEARHPHEDLQGSWRAWFDDTSIEEEAKESESMLTEEKKLYDKNIEIPSHNGSISINIRSKPMYQGEVAGSEPALPPDKYRKGTFRTFKIILLSFAAIAASLAVLGSGYTDGYSSRNVWTRTLSGMTLYKQ